MTGSLLQRSVEAAIGWDGSAPLVFAGDPVLRHPADLYEGQFSADVLDRLVEVMRKTLNAAGGVGLAAVQIGIPLQLMLIRDPAEVSEQVAATRLRRPVAFEALLNPRLTPRGETTVAFYEGCLSLPGFQAVVRRPLSVHIDAIRPDGSGVSKDVIGWPARILQHETDHLQGVLYLDRAVIRSVATQAAYENRWSAPSPGEAAQELGFAL
jgi:peptide deformylase